MVINCNFKFALVVSFLIFFLVEINWNQSLQDVSGKIFLAKVHKRHQPFARVLWNLASLSFHLRNRQDSFKFLCNMHYLTRYWPLLLVSHTFLARILQKLNISEIVCKNLASILHFRQNLSDSVRSDIFCWSRQFLQYPWRDWLFQVTSKIRHFLPRSDIFSSYFQDQAFSFQIFQDSDISCKIFWDQTFIARSYRIQTFLAMSSKTRIFFQDLPRFFIERYTATLCLKLRTVRLEESDNS